MSADNWTICPNCETKRQNTLKKKREKADASYGVLPVEEYLAMRAIFEKEEQEEPLRTFREDYEIGVVDGVFEVNFRGSCHICNKRFEFKHQEKVG